MSDGFYTNPVVRYELTRPLGEGSTVAVLAWAAERGATARTERDTVIVEWAKGELVLREGDRLAPVTRGSRRCRSGAWPSSNDWTYRRDQMPTTTALRDALRERDLAARGVTAEVRVEGLRLLIEMDPTAFDDLIRPEDHDECFPCDLIEGERIAAHGEGFNEGYASALRDVRALAP